MRLSLVVIMRSDVCVLIMVVFFQCADEIWPVKTKQKKNF